jgi:hypothetical protein
MTIKINELSSLQNDGEKYIPYSGDDGIAYKNSIDKINNRSKTVSNNSGYFVLPNSFDWEESLIGYSDSVLEIRYNFDLGGATINLPNDVLLKESGGILKNGTIVGNNTKIENSLNQLFDKDVIIQGTWDVEEEFLEWHGAKGDGLTDDYLALKNVGKISKNIKLIDDKIYKIANIEQIDLVDGVKFSGKGTLKFSDKSNRFLSGLNISNFELKDLKIDSESETSEGYIGGGYLRFENCHNFTIENLDILKTAWDGVKFLNCTNFKMTYSNINYCKSSGVQVENCQDYVIEHNDLSKNGLMSTDDSYADLPIGWTGSHIGRGITIYNDSKKGKVRNNSCNLNSEYGIRLYADDSLAGCEDIEISNNECRDNGAPAGTYGTIVLTSDKGVDILINNSDTISKTTSITVKDNEVTRELKPFGQCYSLHLYEGDIRGNKSFVKGSAINKAVAYFLYGVQDSVFRNNWSNGSLYHLAYGSQTSTNNIHEDDKGFNCLKFIHSNPSGKNWLINAFSTHISDTAVSGEDGISVADCNWIIKGLFLDGFYNSFVTSQYLTDLTANSVTVVNSVANGLRNYAVNAKEVKFIQCNFDTINPSERANVVYNAGLDVSISLGASLPSTGYYKAGSIVLNIAFGTTAFGNSLFGWKKQTSGTSNVLNTDWIALFIKSTDV